MNITAGRYSFHFRRLSLQIKTQKLTSNSLQFLWVMSELFKTQGIVLSMGIESSYVPNGLVHSSAPRSMSLHGEPLR